MGDHVIQIDNKSYQTMINGDRFDGECSECGAKTTGLFDGEDGSLNLLKSLHNPDEKWFCESCFFEQEVEEE